MGRPVTFDHKNSRHTRVALSDERHEAIAQIARRYGVSQHVVLQRFISIGLSLYGEDVSL